MSKDYGLRISYDGKDVNTCSDIDCVLTTKFPNLKGTLTGTGSVTCSQAGGVVTVTIPHNLGYIPFVRVFSNSWWAGEYSEIPAAASHGVKDWSADYYADANNLYISFAYSDGEGAYITWDYSYSYFIYKDKGKL